jgi:hypothetical protein
MSKVKRFLEGISLLSGHDGEITKETSRIGPLYIALDPLYIDVTHSLITGNYDRDNFIQRITTLGLPAEMIDSIHAECHAAIEVNNLLKAVIQNDKAS